MAVQLYVLTPERRWWILDFEITNGKEYVIIYRPYITKKNGERLYSKDGKMLRLKIPKEKFKY